MEVNSESCAWRDDGWYNERPYDHTHFITDTISVCKQCAITLRMVHVLYDSGFYEWQHVRDAFISGEIFDVPGIGAVSAYRLMDILDVIIKSEKKLVATESTEDAE